MLTERRERLVAATVAVLIEARAQYLAEGANPLKHWDQLQERMRIAARTSDGPEQWFTTLCRELRLARAPSRDLSTSVLSLAELIGPDPGEWLEWLEAEHGLVFARLRLEAERRKAESEARRAAAVTKEQVVAAVRLYEEMSEDETAFGHAVDEFLAACIEHGRDAALRAATPEHRVALERLDVRAKVLVPWTKENT
jgi:hypothetical protein